MTRVRTTLLVTALLALLAVPLAAQGTRLLRQPTVSASHIAFMYANDIWVVARSGGDARRVTSFSPRYRTAFSYPVTATLDPFRAKRGHGEEEVEKLHQAWLKSVILQVTLWSQPYILDGDF